MQILIESPRFELDDTVRQLIREKTGLLSKLNDRITKCTVIVKEERDDSDKKFHVDVQLSVAKKILFAGEKDQTFEVALNKVMSDLASQLRRYKSKLDEKRLPDKW